MASAIASGRRPSKVTINTREIAGAGVAVSAGVDGSAAAGGTLLGVRVAVRGGAVTSGVGEAPGPQLCRKIAKRVRIQMR